eukprot:9151243-Pyramimonas_sp.AAC.1
MACRTRSSRSSAAVPSYAAAAAASAAVHAPLGGHPDDPLFGPSRAQLLATQRGKAPAPQHALWPKLHSVPKFSFSVASQIASMQTALGKALEQSQT